MMRRSLPSLALLLALAVAALPAAGAPAAVLPADATAVISGTPDLLSLPSSPVADSHSGLHAVSRDGTRVVFDSSSDGLAPDDDDSVINVYVKDLMTGEVTLVSRASDVVGVPGEPAHADCSGGTISSDGLAVAFTCDGPLDAADRNGTTDIYVRSLLTGQTSLVSSTPTGAAGNATSGPAVVTHTPSNVTFVAFQSNATDLVSGPPPAPDTSRIYRREIDPSGSATTLLVAGDTTGAQRPSISDDGSKVAFDTQEQLDLADNNNNARDVYVRTIAAGAVTATTLVSRATNGALGVNASTDGLISGDGTAVAFDSLNPFDAARDSGTDTDIYLRRLGGTPTTTLVDVTAAGVKAGGASQVSGIDDDGGAVAFESTATNLAGDASPGEDAFVNSGAGAVLVSQGDGTAGPAFDDVAGAGAALDGDGKLAVMTVDPGAPFDDDTGRSQVLVRDVGAPFGTRTVSLPPGGAPSASGFSSRASVSADGRYVAFQSTALGLGVPASVVQAILVRDVATGAIALASRQDGPGGAPLAGDASGASISGDDHRVAFTAATVDSLQANIRHIYVRDLVSGRTLIADRPDGPETGTLGDGSSGHGVLSDDGNRVAFHSTAKNLVPGVSDGREHVYVRDFAANRTFLIDRQSGEQGTPADGSAFRPAISGDGHTVVFDTLATNLLPGGDANGDSDVYARDVDAPFATRLVSATAQGAPGDAPSIEPSIGDDGKRVAFLSDATNFDGSAAGTTLFLRDLGAAAPVAVGRADGSTGTIVAGIDDGALSADGQHVAFDATPATSIAPGAPADGVRRTYERDLASGATRLISRLSGPSGTPSPATDDSSPPSLTADGGCVTFTVQGRFLPPPASADFTNVFMRAVEPNCGRPVPPPPPPPPPPGAKAAVLSHLSVKPARFHVGGRTGGTRIAFRLDKASSVTLAFDRLLPGRLKGRRCLTTAHKGRRCTVVRRVGHITVSRARAGASTVRFSGRLGRRTLAPGTYRLTATPLHGKAVTVRFVVVKAPKPRPKRGR